MKKYYFCAGIHDGCISLSLRLFELFEEKLKPTQRFMERSLADQGVDHLLVFFCEPYNPTVYLLSQLKRVIG